MIIANSKHHRSFLTYVLISKNSMSETVPYSSAQMSLGFASVVLCYHFYISQEMSLISCQSKPIYVSAAVL